MDSNTIYEYYQQVSDRFYVAKIEGIKIQYLWQPFARKVTITGFEDFDLFIYQDKEYTKYKSCYYLCEGLIGAIILRQCDLQSRIMRRATFRLFTDCLPAELNRMGGRANLNQKIVDFLCDYEQEFSPRYKTKKV